MPKTTKQRTVKELVAAARLRETSVPICLAGDLQGEMEDLERQLADVAAVAASTASLADEDPRAAIVERMAALREEMGELTVQVRLRAVPAKAWSDLVAAHPPQPGTSGLFDPATFAPAAIVACCVDPVMSAQEYAELAEHLTVAQEDALFEGVWRINTTGAAAVPFSLSASAILASLTAAR